MGGKVGEYRPGHVDGVCWNVKKVHYTHGHLSPSPIIPGSQSSRCSVIYNSFIFSFHSLLTQLTARNLAPNQRQVKVES